MTGRPPAHCDYCGDDDVPVQAAGSVAGNSGGGYTTYACDACREDTDHRSNMPRVARVYGVTPGRYPSDALRSKP